MKKIILSVFILLSSIPSFASAEKDYWKLNSQGNIVWVNDGRRHFDHIEMSGKKMSVVLRYGIAADGSFQCNFGMVWPLLRTIPNNTHASLMRHLGWNTLEAVTVNQRSLDNEHVDSIKIDGMLKVYSHFGKIRLTRIFSPSTNLPALLESYQLTNDNHHSYKVVIDDVADQIVTNKAEGVAGEYMIEHHVQKPGVYELKPGESLSFSAYIYGRKRNEPMTSFDMKAQLALRRSLVDQWNHELVLETPDKVLNQMFAYSKIRACESIYETKAGPMHGPGGESYYAAIWANDQAEYANPFFPLMGYDYAIQSCIVSWNLFAKWMNKDWKPIPSSIIAEGDDYWNGAGDRGDAAMIAYGAGRFALELGSREEALELWPLITWCLEYCHRNLNEEGVVKSDHDELEGRFPAGTANLNTSCLYYDALCSAAYLEKDLKKGDGSKYMEQAKQLRTAIDRYFHTSIQGFDTYKYYKENKLLRSWICVPLTMGIFDHAKGTVDALFSSKLWTENGLLTQQGDNTFWDRSTLYALRGAFMAGETNKTLEFLKKYSNTRLLGAHVPYAIEAWPEGNQRHLSAESALYARIFTEGVFGMRAVGLHKVKVTPRLPDGWDQMSLKNIHLCGGTFDLTVYRKNGKVFVCLKTKSGKKVTKATAPNGTLFDIN